MGDERAARGSDARKVSAPSPESPTGESPPAGLPASRAPGWDLLDAAAVLCFAFGLLGLVTWLARAAGQTAAAYARAIAWPALTLPCVALVVRRWWNVTLAELGVRKPRPDSWRWFVRFGLVVGLGYLALGGALVLAFRGRFDVTVSSSRALVWARGWGVVPLALSMLVAAPAVEELVHRGVLYPALRARLGRGRAIAVSAVIFAGIHPLMAWRLFVPVTQLLGGLIFAWSYERTRSLLYPAIFHVTGNAAILAWQLVLAYRPGWVAALFG